MRENLKALYEQKAKLAAEIQRYADILSKENRDLTAEENEGWVKLNADYDTLKSRIEKIEQADKITAESAARLADTHPAGGDGASLDTRRTLAFSAWCRSQYGIPLNAREQEACHALGYNPHTPEMRVQLYDTHNLQAVQRRYRDAHPNRAMDAAGDFRATLSIGSGPSGGYLQAPETLVRTLELNMLAFGGVRQVADTIRTTSGEPVTWPTADDTTNTGAQLGESTSIGSSVDPTFGTVTWNAYKFHSKAILVPYELLEDSVFDLPSIIGQMFGERLGRITNTKYTTGTGAATPKGIVTCATTYSAASATAIAADDLIKLQHSVDPAYRAGASFMMHDTILRDLRLLKDGNGAYMFQAGLSSGAPDRLLGAAITINQDMASSSSSGTKTILWGQLGKYKIRSVNGMRMYRLQERYRDTDQDGFIAFIREDGNLLTSTTAPVKVLTH